MGIVQYSGILLSALRHFAKRSVCVGLAWGGISATAFAAPPDITSLFPAGAAPGETQEVTAAGTFGVWPPTGTVVDSRLKLEFDKDKGKVKIAVAADAAPGIAWLRVMDAEGASAPRPFVIGREPSVLEKEPNDKPKQAQALNGPSVVHGKFNKGGDSDSYAIQLTAGQTLVAQLQAHQIIGSPADAAVQICDENGQVLAMNQDASGLDPLLTYTAKRDGAYLVRAFALPASPDSTINFAGGEAYIYRLTITAGPFADAALPLAVAKDSPGTVLLHGWNVPAEPVAVRLTEAAMVEPFYWSPPVAGGLMHLKRVTVPIAVAGDAARAKEGQQVEVPLNISGVVAQPRETHRFAFAGKKGTKLAFVAEAENIGYDLDPYLKLFGPDGAVLGEIDDAGRERDATLNATLPADGNYVFELRDLHRGGGPRHVYRLTIETPPPKVSLGLPAGSHLLEVGKPLELAVTVNRQHGFDGEIKVEAVDLPPGVTAEAATSEKKGDTAKQVKLKFTAAEDAKAGPIRIVARAEDGSELATATFAQTLGGTAFQHAAIWLAIKGAK